MDKLSLDSLEIKNYKNLLNGVTLTNLSILIGPNGSGKSNFIDILEFLKNCVISTTDESRSSSQFDDAILGIGGYNILDRSAKIPERVNITYNFSETSEFEKGLKLNLNLFVGAKDSKVTIAEDSLSDFITEHTPFYYYRFHDRKVGGGVVSVYNDTIKKKSHFETVEDVPTNAIGIVILHDLLEKSANPPQITPIYKVRRRLLDYIKRWHFYNANYMNLETIRTSEPRIGSSDLFLSHSGANLAIVIENLIQQNIDFEDNLNYAMKSILPITRRLRPIRTGLMTVNLEWHFAELSEPFYLNSMSDGTVRMLCWASVLLSPTPPTLLVIDEPELGVHTAWLPILAEWIKRASNNTQVIITTHSPDLLDNFTDCLQNVFRFSSDQDQMHFTISPLSEKDMLQEKLNEGWKLGDLYRVGDPSIGGWPW